MKKKSGLLILSHRPDRVCLTMRFAFFIGLLSMILLLSPASLNAAGKVTGSDEGTAPQQVKVTGTITDATTKEPLVGVNVVLEGTTIGVMTDIKGKFYPQCSKPQRNISRFPISVMLPRTFQSTG